MTTNRFSNGSRTGATVALVAIILPVLLLIVGFSVDLAYMQLARAELRAAADLAAKAASIELSDTDNTSLAIAKGQLVASANLVAGEGLTLENSDFSFGNTAKVPGGKWVFTAGDFPRNAVQVQARRTASAPDGEVGLFFSRLMGRSGYAPTVSATSSFVDSDVCLVLDRSSSMKLALSDTAQGMSSGNPRMCDTPWPDSRWIALDNAVGTFLTKMDATMPREQVAVVTFASNHTACSTTTQAVTLNQPLTQNLSDVDVAMGMLSGSIWNGNTEISNGMAMGRSELTGPRARSTAQKIMIVLTDGVFTNGVHPDGEAAQAADDEITVHTITFGNVSAQAITDMQQTANAGGGDHYHAPDAATLNAVFTEIAGAISILTN